MKKIDEGCCEERAKVEKEKKRIVPQNYE